MKQPLFFFAFFFTFP
ncbi:MULTISPECIES: hypothetical protein [Erwiniaceae]|nr:MULTISPECIES: hypothetical protein [Erwiniaceae]